MVGCAFFFGGGGGGTGTCAVCVVRMRVVCLCGDVGARSAVVCLAGSAVLCSVVRVYGFRVLSVCVCVCA